jgi:predicted metalloprotease
MPRSRRAPRQIDSVDRERSSVVAATKADCQAGLWDLAPEQQQALAWV